MDRSLVVLRGGAGLSRPVENGRPGVALTRCEARAKDDPRVAVLTRIPGVGIFFALLVVAEIGEVSRFPSFPPPATSLASPASLHTFAAPASASGSARSRTRDRCISAGA
jgi:Transposase IS116/IS110/IS902 family